MHPACPNRKQNHLQNSLLRRTQFWVRKTFSKPASLKRASLVIAKNRSSVIRHFWFFSSSMADVALWLGPYMTISSKNVICTKTQKVRKCRQITTNQKPHKPARRPANPPARFAFRQRRTANQTHKRGKSPNKNTHKEDLPRDTAV